MSQGVEYAFSRQKELFDQTVAVSMMPFAFGARIVLSHALREQPGEDSNPEFDQERSGADGVPFDVHKFRTFVTGTREPLGRTAEVFRWYGFDELLQARNILQGDMSVTGYRPIPAAEEEAIFDSANSGLLVDAWKRIVRPTKPGILSTFSLRNHRHPEKVANMIRLAPLKLALDIDDVFRGSLESDIAFMAAAFKTLAIGGAPQEAVTDPAPNPPT